MEQTTAETIDKSSSRRRAVGITEVLAEFERECIEYAREVNKLAEQLAAKGRQ